MFLTNYEHHGTLTECQDHVSPTVPEYKKR